MLSEGTNSQGSITSTFFGAKFGRHVEELLVSPLPQLIILTGYVSRGVFQAMMVGVLVWLACVVIAGFGVVFPICLNLLTRGAGLRS